MGSGLQEVHKTRCCEQVWLVSRCQSVAGFEDQCADVSRGIRSRGWLARTILPHGCLAHSVCLQAEMSLDVMLGKWKKQLTAAVTPAKHHWLDVGYRCSLQDSSWCCATRTNFDVVLCNSFDLWCCEVWAVFQMSVVASADQILPRGFKHVIGPGSWTILSVWPQVGDQACSLRGGWNGQPPSRSCLSFDTSMAQASISSG